MPKAPTPRLDRAAERTAPDGLEPLRSFLLAGRRDVLALEGFDSSPIVLGKIVNSLREPVMVRGTTRGVVELALSRSPLRENHDGAGSILNLHGAPSIAPAFARCASCTTGAHVQRTSGLRVRRATHFDSNRHQEAGAPGRAATGPWFASSGLRLIKMLVAEGGFEPPTKGL